MTNDFDDLASAYIDGQLTEIEAARVEGDPELLAQVAELRSVSEALDVDVSPPDEALKRQQLGAALAAFDQLQVEVPAATTDGGQAETSGVVDLAKRRADSESAKRPTSQSRGRAGLPSWLGVAAGLLLLVGGIGFLSQVTGGSDDAETTAADSADDATEAVLTERSSGESADFAQGAEQEEAMEDEAMEDADAASSAVAGDGDAEDAAESDESAGEESDDDAEEAEPAATTTPATQSPPTSTTAGGLFPPDSVDAARVFLGEIPDDEVVATLAESDLLAPSLSQCGADGELANGRSIVGFVPVAVGEVNGEVLFVELEPAPLAVILTEACTPFE